MNMVDHDRSYTEYHLLLYKQYTYDNAFTRTFFTFKVTFTFTLLTLYTTITTTSITFYFTVTMTLSTFDITIFYAVDYSDDTAPGTAEAVLEYNDHKIASTYQGFSIYIPNPKSADATSAERGGWVATSNPSLNWYGLKYAIPPTQVVCQFYVVVTYYVACKDPK